MTKHLLQTTRVGFLTASRTVLILGAFFTSAPAMADTAEKQIAVASSSISNAVVEALRCEYSTSPLGIDTARPRLSWQLRSEERGQRQTAYQILVASSPDSLAKDHGDLWDTGKVVGSQSIHMEYAGRSLASKTRCFWKVRTWDRNDHPTQWSQSAAWQMGLLLPDDWQAKWIGATANRKGPTEAERIGRDAETSPHPPYAAPLLRKEFVLPKSPLRATLYACGLGYCEITINGKRVNNRVLDPNFTDYTKRVSYTTDDVSAFLKIGPNAIGVVLGAGWYDTPATDVWKFHLAPWIATPKLLLRMDIEYPDGGVESIVSDATWKTSDGPIVFNSIRGGETYDARREKLGWDSPGYDGSAWAEAQIVLGPAGRLESQCQPPIRIVQSLRPVAVSEPKPGVFVFDFGVNIVGWAKIDTGGPSGQAVKLEYNELRNADGTVNMQHMADFTPGRFQTDRFILKGKGIESFEPRFTYHGFRYVQVTGLTQKPTLDTLTARWVHTDVQPAGDFSCSNPLLNTIHEMIVRTQQNNLHGIPTDCPQREKIGWTCDGCISMEEAICNFDMAAFYTKWFRDMLDAQDANGHAACIAPSPGWGRSLPDGSPGVLSDPWWGGAIIRMPWMLYRYYGDRRILAEGYPAMCRYLDYLQRYSKDNIAWAQEGDWLEVGSGGASQRTPPQLATTAAYCFYAKTLGEIASLLNKPDDARRYAGLAENIRRSFQQHFFRPNSGRYADDSQTASALALHFGITPAEQRPLVIGQFLKNIQEERKGHISSGIVGTLHVFWALMELGRDDLAYQMVTQRDLPSWGYMVDNGATTIWESWNGTGSHNHPALGCVDAWFYQGLGGIRFRPETLQSRTIEIHPAIVGGLSSAKTSYQSILGRISSEWKVKDGELTLDIVVPANMTAMVHIPTDDVASIRESGMPTDSVVGVVRAGTIDNSSVFRVNSGHYRFQSRVAR